MDLNDAVAVVTGAGSGIGRAIANSLAGRGARVLVTDLDAQRADTVATEIGGMAVARRCDVTRLDELVAARDHALERFGRIDVVVNNVGVLAVGDVLDIPIHAWERIVDVNLMSVVRSNHVFLPVLVEQHCGHVVNTASTAGLLPYGYDRLPYTATKHAIVGLSEALRLRLAPDGIGVSCLCPAGVFTNILEQITFFGEPRTPTAPSLPVVDPDVVGELVAAGIEENRFLILTAPAVRDELRERGIDIEAYLERITAAQGSTDE